LLLANVNPKIVSERLGHSSITLAMDTHSHVLPGIHDHAAGMVRSVLERTGKTIGCTARI